MRCADGRDQQQNVQYRGEDHHMDLSWREIHLWHANTTDVLVNASLTEYLACLSQLERGRYDRFQFDASRQEFLAGQVLVRSALSEYSDVEPTEWEFALDSYGKPRLKTQDGLMPLYFNLSHSGGRLVCAVGRHESTGVDIEAEEPGRRIRKIAHRHFAKAEVSQLLSLPDEAMIHRFYELWTLKESYIKARGKGLALALQDFEFEFDDEVVKFREHQPMDASQPTWQFWQLQTDKQFHLALACQPGDSEPIRNLRSFRMTQTGHSERETKLIRSS